MSKAQQERIKLFAGYLNTIGAGMIVTGIVAPIAAVIINPGLSGWPMIYFGTVALLLSLFFHAVAQAILGELPDDPA